MNQTRNTTHYAEGSNIDLLSEETGTFLDILPLKYVKPIVNVLSIIINILNWSFLISSYEELPEWVPMQYGFSGLPTWTAPKFGIFIMGIIASYTLIRHNLKVKDPRKEKEYADIINENKERYVLMKKLVYRFSGLFIQLVLLIASGLLVRGPFIAITERRYMVRYMVGVGLVCYLIGFLLNRSLIAQVNKKKSQ